MLDKKYFVAITSAVFCIFCSVAHGEDPSFVIEEEMSSLPSSVNAAIRADRSFAGYEDCELIGKSVKLSGNNNTSGFVATTKDACNWGSAKGPIWLVRVKDQKTYVVLDNSGYSLQLLPQIHHGLHDVTISAATAGWNEEATWVFDGSRYVNALIGTKKPN